MKDVTHACNQRQKCVWGVYLACGRHFGQYLGHMSPTIGVTWYIGFGTPPPYRHLGGGVLTAWGGAN